MFQYLLALYMAIMPQIVPPANASIRDSLRQSRILVTNRTDEPAYTWLRDEDTTLPDEKVILRYFYSVRGDVTYAGLMQEMPSTAIVVGIPFFIHELSPGDSFVYLTSPADSAYWSRRVTVQNKATCEDLIGCPIPEEFKYSDTSYVVGSIDYHASSLINDPAAQFLPGHPLDTMALVALGKYKEKAESSGDIVRFVERDNIPKSILQKVEDIFPVLPDNWRNRARYKRLMRKGMHVVRLSYRLPYGGGEVMLMEDFLFLDKRDEKVLPIRRAHYIFNIRKNQWYLSHSYMRDVKKWEK